MAPFFSEPWLPGANNLLRKRVQSTSRNLSRRARPNEDSHVGNQGQLTLEPTNENGKRTYLAHGNVDFFGGEDLAHSDGAGGQNRTGYARLFRAALYR